MSAYALRNSGDAALAWTTRVTDAGPGKEFMIVLPDDRQCIPVGIDESRARDILDVFNLGLAAHHGWSRLTEHELRGALQTVKSVLDAAPDEKVADLWVDDFTTLSAYVDAELGG